MKRLAVALVVVLLLACKSVTSGVVIGKNYSPAYTYITTVCAAYDAKTSACTVYVPVTNYVPDSWTLELRDDSEDKPTKDQDTGWVEVDAATFGQYKLGSHYP